MTTKPTTIILSGFALVVLLILILLVTSLYQLKTTEHALEEDIHTESKHAALSTTLQNLSDRRSNLLLEILQNDDPFVQDESIQKFYDLGQTFIQTRQTLLNTRLANYEGQLISDHAKNSSIVISAQHQVIRLATEGNKEKATSLFMSQALPAQQKGAAYLNKLSQFQHEEIEDFIIKLTNKQEQIHLIIIIGSFGLILACISIALFIYRKLTLNITQIQNARDDLQDSLSETSNLKFALDEHAIVSITDTKGTITYANNKFCEISQYSLEELIGKKHNIINSGFHDKKVFKNMWTTIVSGATWNGKIKNRKKDGSYYWVETTIVPFLDKNNLPYQYIAIRTEITHIKNIEEDLKISLEQLAIEAEKSQESNTLKDALVSTMTHELRTPLNSILGFTQLLQLDDADFSDIQIDNINNIQSAGNELLNKIEIIMLYSKLKSNTLKLQYSESELGLIFESVLNKLKLENTPYNVFPTLKSTEIIDIAADITLFQKALSYILNNAMKFTHNGHIHISYEVITKSSELPAHPVPAINDLILITIEDTGIGITDENLQLIFGEFRQVEENDNRRFEGIGIGLSLTKSIVEQHNGEIWLTSKINVGTTVYITIPNAYGSVSQASDN